MKLKLIITSLLLAFTLQVSADAQRHLVLLKGSAKNFDSSVNALGATVVFRHDKTGFAVVEGLNEEGAATLAGMKSVDSVAPNFSFELPNTVQGDIELNPGDQIMSPEDPTTAFFYPRQWNLRAVEADNAWAAGRTGSSDVTVAILDTGIAYTHADLAGLVDLERSASFLPLDDFYAGLFFPDLHPITDLHYHGTHVAATVASNAFAAAGVTSNLTLMGVKVCSVVGGCPGDAIFAGIIHAVDNGADVINMSLGGSFSKREYPGAAGFFNKLYNYASAQGVTIVVSAGNSGLDLDHDGDGYKTYCTTPATICVSATGPTAADSSVGPFYEVDALAPYSNFGRSAINVAAPGGSAQPVRAACSNTSLIISICQTGTYVVGLNGTSMAAPHVSALAGLMVEDHGRNPGRIKTAIQNSADDLGQPGVDPAYGKGRINVMNAVD